MCVAPARHGKCNVYAGTSLMVQYHNDKVLFVTCPSQQLWRQLPQCYVSDMGMS